MYVTGEETLNDLFRFTVAHQGHINLRKINGSSATREFKARAMYWAKKEDEKLDDTMKSK
jgi:hypothetical protein